MTDWMQMTVCMERDQVWIDDLAFYFRISDIFNKMRRKPCFCKLKFLNVACEVYILL